MKKLLRTAFGLSLLYSIFLLIDLHNRPGDDALGQGSQTASSRTPAEVGDSPSYLQLLARKHFPRRSSEKSQESIADEQPQTQIRKSNREEAFVEKLSSSSHKIADKPRRSWERHDLRPASDNCPRDRDCTPKGRDGVLMIGTSFVAQQGASQWQGVWNLGSSADQSPLLHLR